MGWSLAGFSAITRCPKTIAQDGAPSDITVTNADAFCLDGQRLFPVSGANGASGTEYRTEIESFSRITSAGVQGNGPANFTVESKSGQILTYKPFAQVFPNTAYTWAINMVRDKLNNCLQITYSQGVSGYELYPTQIDYSGRYSNGTCTGTYNRVTFVYENRPDPFTGFPGNNVTWLKQRLTGIDTTNPAGLVKRYQVTYEAPAPVTGRSRLSSVVECDNFGCVAGHMLPPTTFAWQTGTDGFTIQGTTGTVFTDNVGYNNGNRFFQMDINGDGRVDLVARGSDGAIFIGISDGNSFPFPVSTPSAFSDAAGFGNGNRFFPMDINGDGRGDLVIRNGTGDLIVWSSNGSTLTPTGTTPTVLTDAAGWNSGQRFFIMDMNADGRGDIVARSGAGNLSVYLSNGTGFILGSTSGALFPDALGWNDPTRFFPSDINADGISDLTVRTAVGHLDTFIYGGGVWGVYPSGNALSDAAGYNSGQRLFSMDVNGDGRTDIVARDSAGNLLVQLSYGFGFGQISFTPTVLTDVGGWNTGNRYFPMDVNGDGRTDLVVRDANGNFIVYRATDNGFILASSTPTGFTDAAGWNTGRRFFVMDVGGDGRADIVARASDGTLTTLRANGVSPDLMLSATNGLGAQTTIVYRPLTFAGSNYTKGTSSSYPTVDLQLPLYVVASASYSNGIGATLSTTYAYSGLKSDLQGRGSLGFASTSASSSISGLTTQTITTYYEQTYPFIGLVSQQDVSTVTVDGRLRTQRLLKRTQNTFATTGALSSPTQTTSTRYFPYISSTLEQSYDYTTGGLVGSTTTNFSYGDGWGNPTSVSVSTSDGFTATTTNTYLNNSASWVIGRLTSAIVTRGATGQTAQTRTASFTPDGNTGLTTQEIIEPNNATMKVISDYVYDIYGNRTSVTIRTDLPSTSAYWFPSRTTSTSYVATTANPIAGQFPSSSTNATGTQSES